MPWRVLYVRRTYSKEPHCVSTLKLKHSWFQMKWNGRCLQLADDDDDDSSNFSFFILWDASLAATRTAPIENWRNEILLSRAHFWISRSGTWNVKWKLHSGHVCSFVIWPRANDECHFWLIDLQKSKWRMSRRGVDRLEAFRIAWVGRNLHCFELFIYISVDSIRFFFVVAAM